MHICSVCSPYAWETLASPCLPRTPSPPGATPNCCHQGIRPLFELFARIGKSTCGSSLRREAASSGHRKSLRHEFAGIGWTDRCSSLNFRRRPASNRMERSDIGVFFPMHRRRSLVFCQGQVPIEGLADLRRATGVTLIVPGQNRSSSFSLDIRESGIVPHRFLRARCGAFRPLSIIACKPPSPSVYRKRDMRRRIHRRISLFRISSPPRRGRGQGWGAAPTDIGRGCRITIAGERRCSSLNF